MRYYNTQIDFLIGAKSPCAANTRVPDVRGKTKSYFVCRCINTHTLHKKRNRRKKTGKKRETAL